MEEDEEKMKKLITLIYPQMVMGGAEKVLIRLIEAIDREKFDINIILLKHGGALESSVPKDVRVDYAETIPLSTYLRQGKLLGFIKGVYYRLRIRLAKTYEEKSFWSVKCCAIPDTISKDCVICFSHYNFMSICIAAQSEAKCKILWVHLTFRENRNQKLYENLLSAFDHVFCVSYMAKDNFDVCFPQYSDRSSVVYNLINKEKILQDSECEPEYKMRKPAIVTVGRLDEQKGLGLIPLALRKLLDCGYDVFWYLVGEGEYRGELERLISMYHLQGHLILVGNQMNPFPYMRQCDIYAQPSFYEGFCTTTNEARILCKPVVASDILPMREQFQDGETGLLVDLTSDALFQGIKKLLDHPELCRKFSEALKSVHIDNQAELKKLYRAIDENG